MALSAEELIRILDAVAEKTTYKKYDQAWRVNGRLLHVERRAQKFRICVYWPKRAPTSWLIPESAFKRLLKVVPEIASKLADPAMDFSKDK